LGRFQEEPMAAAAELQGWYGKIGDRRRNAKRS